MSLLKGTKAGSARSLRKKAKATVLCSEPEDMLAPAVCALVAEVVRPWLERHQLSPLEFLTDKSALTAFKNNARAFNAAVAGGAKKQVELAGGSLQKRARKFEAYLGNYYRSVVAEETAPIVIEAIKIDRDYNNLIGDFGSSEARLHLIRSLAHHLASGTSWGAKVKRLLVLLEKSRDQATLAVLDEMVAGFLWIDVAAADIFIDEPNPFALLFDMMGLVTSQPKPRRGACRVIERLTSLMAEHDLALMRAAFQRAFERTLRDTMTFSCPRNFTGTKLMLWELSELTKLHKKMVACGGWFTSTEPVTAIDVQVARRTGLLQLDQYTADHPGIFAKTIELSRIYQFVFGARNVKRVQERIFDNMMKKDLTYLLAHCARSPMEQLGFYGVLEQKIRKAKIVSGRANDMTEHLSELQETFIREKKVFHKFRYMRTSYPEKGIYLLEMLTLGVFTTGRCKQAAIKLMTHFIPSKLGLLEYVSAIEGVSSDEDRAQELAALYDYFTSPVLDGEGDKAEATE